MYDEFSQFIDAIRATGLEPPTAIQPGKLHRFPGIGKRPSNRAGWCLLFEDGQGGCFGDWSSGFTDSWQEKRDKPLSPSERIEFASRVRAAQEHAKAELRAKQNEAAKKAVAIWNNAVATPDGHPYLVRKNIPAFGAKLYKSALLLPVTDFTGKLTSLQFIDSDGGERLLSGGRKRGCFIHVAGNMLDFTQIIVCEGWATGCSLAKDESATLVLAAIDAGNLDPVAVTARCRWPAATLVIAGDDDRLTPGNPGATKARAAAVAADAILVLPQWPADAPETLSDFNDLAIWLAGEGT